MRPRIYTYKITFEEVPYYYYGAHKERRYGENYWGSPDTNKWAWEFYTPKKQILEFFDYSEIGWEQAQEIERKIIREFCLNDKWCLNQRANAKISLEARSRGGKTQGKISKENKLGIFGITKEQRVENSRKAGKLGGKVIKENNLGIFSLTKEQLSENGKKGGTKAIKKTNSQRWECLVTGFITAPGPLTSYQRSRGIDTTLRKRIE